MRNRIKHAGADGMRTWETVFKLAVSALLTFALASIATAQNTSTVTGAIADASGAAIPGAAISVISETRGTVFPTTSGPTGDFIIMNIPGDTYTVSVSVPGFRKVERTGIRVVAGDRVGIGTITLEVASTDTTIEVTAQAPLLQTQTGDRATTVPTTAVQQVPTYITGTFFAQAALLAPGVNTLYQGAQSAIMPYPSRFDTVINDGIRQSNGRTNWVLDGLVMVDSGGNQPGVNLNYDAVSEVKVLASAYSAEYGRTSGVQIVGITKSGTNQFHGTIYDIEKRSNWATNSWVNAQNGLPKPKTDVRWFGFSLGGPVGRPNKPDRKLFFFIAEQVSPTTTKGAVNYIRVPTLLERQGDFSQTTDNAGNLFNLIADPASGLPCTSTNRAGCFQDGGVLGRIPKSRLNPIGMAILNMYPEPNVQGLNYNLKTVAPQITATTYQQTARLDYVTTDKLRFFGKYVGQNASVHRQLGNIPGYNDRVTVWPGRPIYSATVTYVLNPTTVLEGSAGSTRTNQAGAIPNTIYGNRCALNDALCNFPQLFPDSLKIIPGSFQEKALKATNVPWFKDGVALLQPQYSWGSRIANAPPNIAYPGFLCWNYTLDAALAVSKVWRMHTIKAGFQFQNSVKIQNLGTQTTGTLPIEGAIDFGNDVNNPLDTGFGFANAAIGSFKSYAQQGPNQMEGRFVYHNRDFYLEDNWKVNSKLSLNLGVRLVHNGPQYDSRGQMSNFFPNLWKASDAPYLFQPGCATGVAPGSACPGVDRVAVNPLTGVSLGRGSAPLIGFIVPDTGNPLNGIVVAGKGIEKTNYTEPFLVPTPRLGMAYSPRGQNLVIRAGVGWFIERAQGDSVFGQLGNPPFAKQMTVYYSSLQQVAAGAVGKYFAPPNLTIYKYDAKLPSSLQWNIGVQRLLPWRSSFDVSWVGVYNYNTIAYGTVGTTAGQLPMDLNAPDLGTAYQSQYQDPTLGTSSVPGATSVNTNLLRPYRGIGSITASWPYAWNRYDTIQMSINKQASHGLSFGGNYVIGLRNVGNMLSPPHFEHSADGSLRWSSLQPKLDSILRDVGTRRHTLKLWGVYQIPKVNLGAKALSFGVSHWQLSTTAQAGTGVPYDVTYSYQTGGGNVNITGSPSYAGRIRIVGDPGSGCSGDRYRQFNTAAFAGPGYGSIGDESGSYLLRGCPDHQMNLSISRFFVIGKSETRRLQLRADAYNVFNTVTFNAFQTTMVLSSPANPTTIVNNQYNADGSLNRNRLTPATAGFGAATGAMAMRSIQLEARFWF
ncbi:MAG: carboxypeptidase regulatory-like domain-containing protein [Bryobacteraceae bacterium]